MVPRTEEADLQPMQPPFCFELKSVTEEANLQPMQPPFCFELKSVSLCNRSLHETSLSGTDVAGAGKTTQEVQVSLPPTSPFLLKGLLIQTWKLKLGQQASSHRSLQACQGPMAGLHRTRTSHPCQENSICLLLFVFK